MKTFGYLMIMLILLATAGLFVVKKPDGSRWLSVDDIVQIAGKNWRSISHYLTATSELVPLDLSIGDKESDKSTIYRWQDEQGTWHFSDSNSGKPKAEKVVYDNNAINILPKVEAPVKPITHKTAPSIKTNDVTDKTDLPLTVLPDKIQKLMTDSNNVQQLMDNRTKKLDNINQ